MVALALFAFGIDDGLRKKARPMVIDIGIEMIAAKGVDQTGKVLRDMAIPQAFADHRAIFRLRECIVIGVSGP